MHVLINSSSSYNSGGGNNPSAYDYSFTGQTVVNISHNLSTHPMVSISNTNGDQIFGEVNYLNLNSFTVSFNTPQSGSIRYI